MRFLCRALCSVVYLSIFLLIDFAHAQTRLDSIWISVTETKPLLQFIEEVEQRERLRFFYIDKWLTPFRVQQENKEQTLADVLKKTLDGTPLSFACINRNQIIFIRNQALEQYRQQALNKAKQSQKQVKKILIGDPVHPGMTRPYGLSGSISNENNLPVNGASLQVDQTNVGTLTDELGKYSIMLGPGEHVLTVSHVNYLSIIIDLEIYNSGTLNLTLDDNPIFLDEVVVTGQSLSEQSVGQVSLKVAELKRAPTFLGEVDIVKQVQQQAGVTTVGEISTGFNVRGGGVDQNLILFDGVPVYNASHALGFFSAFHADAIGNMSFYKSAIPSAFGGRTSSVLNVQGKTGDKQRWRYKAGFGMVSSYLMAEGPIRKDTSSLLVSFRTTYSNWMLRAMRSNYLDLKNSAASFYDGNFKYSSRVGSKGSLSLSGYISQDAFQLVNDTTFQWRNVAVSVRYDHPLRNQWFGSVMAGLGQYSFSLHDDEPTEAFNLKYNLLNPVLKVDFAREGLHKLNFGWQGQFYQFSPGNLKAGIESQLKNIDIVRENAFELSFYAFDEFAINPKIYLEAGLRYTLYLRAGPGTTKLYESGKPIAEENQIDSISYLKGQVMKAYHGPEPRLGVRYNLNQEASIKVGYHRLYQFMHLVTNTAAPTPVDIWQLSNRYFRPQLAHQFSLGYFKGNRESAFDYSADAFYKHINQTLDFKDGANLILNKQLETALLAGVTKAYGVEFSVTKKTGKWVGNANYTFSRSLRKDKTPFDSEQINEGRWYPSNNDQPHIVNISWRYNISRRYFFSGNFTYHTGRPISMPTAFYDINGVPVSDFSERNAYRLKDYHRMDIAFIAEGNHKRKKIWDGTWILSFYNVYQRRNPYAVFFKQDAYGRLRPYQLSLVGTMIPSLSYNIKI